jgi:CMP-N,N'-diacetyllegionaminic acid synthase
MIVALVPARGGSVRIPRKNIKLLNGHPLIAYTIAAALQSWIFDGVYVSTEDPEIATIAAHYGASVIGRPEAMARSDSPDLEWLAHALEMFAAPLLQFALLRPTSPFRTAATIQRAYRQWSVPDQTADSIRAVQPVTEHPGKMWTWQGPGYPIVPLQSGSIDGVPWHSCPTQALPKVFVQNASLEMGWASNVLQLGSISGRKVAPFFTEGYEGIDLNTAADWDRAECAIARYGAQLPPVDVAPLSPTPA